MHARAVRYNALMKRRVFTILLFLLLGAIINVAVAWGFALGLNLGEGFCPTYRSGDAQLSDNQLWVVHVYRTRGRVKIGSHVAVMDTGDRPQWRNGPLPQPLLPTWSSITTPDPDEMPSSKAIDMGSVWFWAVRSERAFGWPWPALRFHTERLSHPQPGMETHEVHGGIVVRRPRFKTEPETIALPLIPILPGLLGNSLVYGLVFACALGLWRMAPFSLKRRRRVAEGRCPACGYILGERLDEGCPECGWKRRSVPAPPRRWRTSGRTVLLYLSLGLALSIALAWVCAWSMDQKRSWQRNDFEITNRDEALAWWRDHAPAGFSKNPGRMYVFRDGLGVSIASGMVFGPGSSEYMPPDEHMIRIRSGWPLRALEGCVWDQPPLGPTIYTGVIAVPGPSVREGWLPIRPLWRGLIINAVFYAVLLRVAMHWPLALRRKARLRAHRCPACGRPMGDSQICEKCGLELPRRRSHG